MDNGRSPRNGVDPARYVLVPRAANLPGLGRTRVRRYSLSRVAVARRSALGVDRHERLEQIAERGSALRPAE
jgi:hypothetical protein